jgi:glutamate 5-kinase
MVIANGDNVMNINNILRGEKVGTLFKARKLQDFNIMDYITSKQYTKVQEGN